MTYLFTTQTSFLTTGVAGLSIISISRVSDDEDGEDRKELFENPAVNLSNVFCCKNN